jgi:hypothetical protein
VIERDAMRERNKGTAREHLTPGGISFVGAEVFWYADKKPQVHSLNAAYFFAPDASDLFVSAFERRRFQVARPTTVATVAGNCPRNG